MKNRNSKTKTRISVAIAALLAASMGTAAYAQSAQQTTAQQPMSAASAYTSQSGQSSQSMSRHSNSSTNNMSSSRVAQKVKQKLQAENVSTNGLKVSFRDGTVTLAGTVYNQADVRKAKSAAKQVQGVNHVDASSLHARSQASQSTATGSMSNQRSGQNNTSQHHRTRNQNYTSQNNPSQNRNYSSQNNMSSQNRMSQNNTSNGQITQEVKQKLRNEDVSVHNLHVTLLQDGTVTLAGTVDSQSDFKKAKSAAKQVQGVKRVDALGLRVQGQTGQSTANAHTHNNSSMSNGSMANSNNSSMSNRNMSNGSMSNRNMSNGSMSNRNMSNNGMSQRGHHDVTNQVKQKLSADGISTNNIRVSFRNGTVTLAGTVDSQADVREAKSAAQQVQGVKHVDTSRLHVQGPMSGSSGLH
jgi:osmotically-inducible protein OsmY